MLAAPFLLPRQFLLDSLRVVDGDVKGEENGIQSIIVKIVLGIFTANHTLKEFESNSYDWRVLRMSMSRVIFIMSRNIGYIGYFWKSPSAL